MLYDQLVSDGSIDPKDVSRPTLYRYIEDLSLTGELKNDEENPKSLRFSHDYVKIYVIVVRENGMFNTVSLGVKING